MYITLIYHSKASCIQLISKFFQKANSDEKTKLTDLICQALDRAEALKGIKKYETETILPNLPSVPETDLPINDIDTETSLPTSSSGT